MPRDVEYQYRFKIGNINHIDLIEVAPVSASLKTYAGRLHAKRLQDLPYNPTSTLTAEQANNVKHYCINDLDCTALLLKNLESQLTLRVELSAQYGQDLRSKSDAQISETVICSEVAKTLGYFPKKQSFAEGTSFKYRIPEYINYKTDVLKNMLEVVKEADFVINDKGKVIIPKSIKSLNLPLGSSVYNLTIGGLHSKEKSARHVQTDDTLLLDVDVESFYPRIILNLGLFPENMGESFSITYENIVTTRLGFKKTNKTKSDSLKIVINGGFGKMGNKYSRFYSPSLMIGVTLSGQLSLLMLIEMIELGGIPIVSGNTDGIVIKCPKNKYDDLYKIINEWENITKFKTEETRYKAICSRDVNNYFAIKEKGKDDGLFLDDELGCKVKGCFAERGSALNSPLSKNPEHLICSDAIMQLLVKNIPIEKTITECKDIRRFVIVRTVKGGAEHKGVYLGKTVRWYYAEKEHGTINYVMSGNKVPKSDGAKPLMDLPDEFPTDINHKRYIDETVSILYDIGYLSKPKQLKFFN
jgi:DNA polymerase elongation subunit (family B)